MSRKGSTRRWIFRDGPPGQDAFEAAQRLHASDRFVARTPRSSRQPTSVLRVTEATTRLRAQEFSQAIEQGGARCAVRFAVEIALVDLSQCPPRSRSGSWIPSHKVFSTMRIQVPAQLPASVALGGGACGPCFFKTRVLGARHVLLRPCAAIGCFEDLPARPAFSRWCVRTRRHVRIFEQHHAREKCRFLARTGIARTSSGLEKQE